MRTITLLILLSLTACNGNGGDRGGGGWSGDGDAMIIQGLQMMNNSRPSMPYFAPPAPPAAFGGFRCTQNWGTTTCNGY